MTVKEFDVLDKSVYTDDMGLNADGIRAVRSYISSDSYIINEKLRQETDDFTLRERQLIQNLDDALNKLPPYKGGIVRSVYLRNNQLEEFLASHQVGSVVTYGTYTSFTSGETYDVDAIVQLHVPQSKKSIDISTYNVAEQEVLYPRNSRFIVLEVSESDGVKDIILKED